MSPELRAAFLELLPELDGEADNAVIAFVRDHWVEALEEIVADPGHEQVRAGLVRVMAAMLPPAERHEVLARAKRVLEGYPEAVKGGGPVLLARHPAWVGLAWLEIAEAAADRPELDKAVALAT